jgi:hypothetical protein
LNAIRIVKAIPSRIDHAFTKRRVMSIRHVLTLVIAHGKQIVNIGVISFTLSAALIIFDQIIAYV